MVCNVVYVYVDVLCVKIRLGFPELCGRMRKGRRYLCVLMVIIVHVILPGVIDECTHACTHTIS